MHVPACVVHVHVCVHMSTRMHARGRIISSHLEALLACNLAALVHNLLKRGGLGTSHACRCCDDDACPEFHFPNVGVMVMLQQDQQLSKNLFNAPATAL